MPSLYAMTVPPLVRALKNNLAIMKYAENYAQTHDVDPQEYTEARLHPDMKDFAYQIYRLTDAARFAVVRVAGAEPLAQPDVETTFPDLIERVRKTIGYLEALDPKTFEGQDEKEVVIYPTGPNGVTLELKLSAVDYLNYYAFPNFWFHCSTAYGVLRSKGVDLGKLHFLNASGEIQAKVVEQGEK